MLVCVAGTGFVSESAARDLLDDMLGNFTVEYLMPRHLVSSGQRNVHTAVNGTSNSWSVSRVPLGYLTDTFIGSAEADKALLVLDPDTTVSNHIVIYSWQLKIPVYDLCKGLYPVDWREDAQEEV